MIGDLKVTKALILPNEGGQSSDGKYYQYLDIYGVPTIGYGFTSAVFPNSVFQTMPKVMTAKQCDLVFKDVLGRYESWRKKVPYVRDGGALTNHQIACFYDIEWQWGGGTWDTKFPTSTLTSLSKIRDFLKSDPNLWVYRNRSKTRLKYWDTKDSTSSKPSTGNQSKPNTSPGNTPQNKPTQKPSTKPNPDKDLVSFDKGIFYLRNTTVTKMGSKGGLTFTRNGDYLILSKPKDTVTSGGTGGSTGDSSSGSGGNSDNKPSTGDKDNNTNTDDKKPSTSESKIQKLIKQLTSVKYNTINYRNIRPQKDPKTCGWADCSGYVGWGFKDLIPEVWSNGTCYTGSINAYFRKKGKVISEGSFSTIKAKGFKKGDVVLMGSDRNTGAGNSSHIVVMLDSTNCIHVGNPDDRVKNPNKDNLENLKNYAPWWTYFVLVRPF